MSNRWPFTRRALLGSPVLPLLVATADIDPKQGLIRVPADPRDWPAFREALSRWRRRERTRLHYDDSLYRRGDLRWAASCYCCCFVMMCDETFWDRSRGRYLVDEFLRTGKREFGGYDALVLWQAYPRIGVDQRNQFDFYRDMPGGLDGLRDLNRRLHARGVKAFVDYNP